MYQTKKSIKELWAVVDKITGEICMSRGGSSTKSKIMVYETKVRALVVLESPWIKQIINKDNADVKQIYSV